jgi:hypothetical protein
LQEHVWLPDTLDDDHGGNQNVAHDHHGKIGRSIISFVMVQGFTAMGAGVIDLQEFAKKFSRAARWTAAHEATQHCRFP